MAKKCIIRQVKSGTNQTKRVNETLKSLGLGRIGKEKEHDIENPCIYGKLKKVEHLVYIKEQ